MQDSQRRIALDGAVELMHFAYRAMTARPDALLASRGLSRVHHSSFAEDMVSTATPTSTNRLLC